MATEIHFGKTVLWGCKPIPDNIEGIPEGSKVRFRVRNTDAMRCFIKKDGVVRHFVIVADNRRGPWRLMEQGANVTLEKPLQRNSPQADDHRRLLARIEGVEVTKP